MATSDPHGDRPAPNLGCLHGAPAPARVVEGWRHLTGLPEAARNDLWQILGAAILQPEATDLRSAIEAVAREHQVPAPATLAALEACDVLLAGAAAANLEPDALAQDLASLAGGATGPPAAELVQRYREVRPLLRERLLEATLADHGKVLTGLDWRVDEVTASDRGVVGRTSVVYLTLRYREGTEEGRLSLQLTPAALRHLRAFTERFGDR